MDRDPEAYIVATIRAEIPNRLLQVAGQAVWLPAAGGAVVWVLTVAEISGGARHMYGAGGPAAHFLEAVTVGQHGMQDDLWRLQPEVRSLADVACVLGGRADVGLASAPDSQAEVQAERVARLQALMAANPGVRPWSSDR
mgnify:CR=1 FL=1